MSETTRHGENIGNQIQHEDAYGYEGTLTLADIWYILDNIHTHFMDTDRDTTFIEKWMEDLVAMDEDLPL